MILTINFESEKPIYVQIVEQVTKGIYSGEISPGESLPSVRQLGSDIGVNLHTVNKAYQILKDKKYIQIDRRSGAYISSSFDRYKDEDIAVLEYDMETLLAGAYIMGIEKDEVIKIVEKIYKKGVR